MKSVSDTRPEVLLRVSETKWHYNYNIAEIHGTDEDGNATTNYEYDTVVIDGTPTYEKCCKAVIREIIDESEEFSMINKYNMFTLGISQNEEYKTRYMSYLNEVVEIKNKVAGDFDVSPDNAEGGE